MDKSWIRAYRTSTEYMDGVKSFLEFAKKNAPKKEGDVFYCPCKRCCNTNLLSASDIEEHLICTGFNEKYTKWIWHGEVEIGSTSSSTYKHNDSRVEEEIEDRLNYMFNNVREDFVDWPEELNKLLMDSEKPLWPGCTTYTKLRAVLELFNLKAGNGWSDKSFTALLSLLHEMLPPNNELPKSTYEAKKVMCPMGIEYKKIHACPNDCILFRKEFKQLHACPICGSSRYKVNDMVDGNVNKKAPPAKVLWYLPIIPRFKRLFANPSDAKNLTWHADARIDDGKLRRPADSLQWKKFDEKFIDFSSESRNLRLGLSTDGMNPYGNLSSKHSSWPVMLVIYNLPPWLCMKRKYIMLSLMISGPKQPGNDISVFLQPLVDDLKKLWDEGISIYDAYRNESFTLRAMLFCTINDFPAYGNLSGYSVKGHKACPICADQTCYQQLVRGRKTVYLGHRRFLNRFHPYRRRTKEFNLQQEHREAPQPLTGTEVYAQVENICVQFGKTQKSSQKTLWKKKSIFFYLPYWKMLEVRHCIDVMHVEKNVCDSLVGTLLDIKGKTKDGLNARLDMVEMCIRPELAPQQRKNKNGDVKMYLPPAAPTLSNTNSK